MLNIITRTNGFCSSFGQFECNCGSPRCIDSSSVGDGVADCADASDEIKESINIPCGDAKLPRRNGNNWRREGGDIPRFCTKEKLRNCPEELGQICIEWPRNHQRCVCRLGFFRAPGYSACLPIESFPHLNVSRVVNLADEYASGRLNCTRLVSDLSMMYPGIFLFRRDGEAGEVDQEKEDKIISNKQHVNSKLIARDEPPISDDDTLDKEECTISEAIDENKIGKECSNGKICVLAGNKQNKNIKNGNYTISKGICVVPINECAESTLNDCHKDARCIDNDFGYECLCPEGYLDTSLTPQQAPGRSCKKLINECLNPLQNDCSPNAYCLDQLVGFTCQCHSGFTDIGDSKRVGRKCVKNEDNKLCIGKNCKTNILPPAPPEAICEERTPEDATYLCHCPVGFIVEYIDESLSIDLTKGKGKRSRVVAICVPIGSSEGK